MENKIMNTPENDTPDAGTTAPLNFGGSSPFTSGQTEPLTDEAPVVEQSEVSVEAPVEETAAAPVEAPAEEVVEVTTASADQVEVFPPDASTIPAEELAPTAEVPATPQTELEAEVAKELEAHASNPAEVPASTVPAELPVIAGKTDAEIEADIKARDALNAKIEDGQKAQRQDVLAQIKKVVETYKIPLPELGEYLGIKGTRKGSKAKPKYKDPASDKTWSGRGKEPLWIKGKDRTGFLITP